MKMSNRNQISVFYNCISKPLIVYRILGLLPIEGLFNSDGKTRFTLKSLYTIYFGIVIFLQSVNIILIYDCFLHKEKKTVIRKPTELITALTSLLVCISLFHLSKCWSSSLRKIAYIETLLSPLQSHKILVHRIKWLTCIMVLICLANTIAYNRYAYMIVNECFLRDDDSGWFLKSYFLTTNAWFNHHVTFNYALGFLAQIVKIQSVVMYHIADVIILTSTAYLTCRVKHFYGCLVQKIKRKTAKEVSWCDLRVHFTRLTTLVTAVDDLISPFIVTMFLSDLLFICKELFDILQQKLTTDVFPRQACVYSHSKQLDTVIFFSLSIATLLSRSSVVFLSTARLHTLGRKPLNALHYAPSSMYDYKMQRLMDQVYYSKIGLSGLRFSYVTRGTVLSMVSTILTFELVLLQIKS